MKLVSLLQVRAVVTMTVLATALLVNACAGPNDHPAPANVAANDSAAAAVAVEPVASADPVPATAATDATPTTAANDQGDAPASDDLPATDGPKAPPISLPDADSVGTLDASCKTNSDCAIKDVGSCCGYNPRCLNKDSKTFPEQVKAKCANDGRVGICGFPAIAGCECVQGKCARLTPTDNDELVQ
jgi:hypothetical protein